MKPKITIGTRAYNAEKTIAQTLESVLVQTMGEFEYWIANNGSTDRTGEIIDEYASRDKRINVIHLEHNQPEFSSMRMLMEHGKGEFFMLLDSDDWLEADFMNELYSQAMKHNVEVAVGGSKFHYIQSGNIGVRKSEISGAFPIEQMPEVYPYIHRFFRPVWGKIFSAEVVRKRWEIMCAKRPEGLMYGGDTFTCFELLYGVNGIYLSDKVVHNYRVHSGSASYVFNFERFNSDVFLLEHAIEYLKGFGTISEHNLSFVYKVYCNAILDTIKVLFSSNLQDENKLEYLERIFEHYHTKYLFEKEYLNDEMLKQYFEVIDYIGSFKVKASNSTLNRVYKAFLSINPILNQCIVKPNFIKTYRTIVKLIVDGKYQKAHELIIFELANDSSSSEEYRVDLLNLMIKTSALLEEPEAFILAHKLLVTTYIQRKENDFAKKILRELEEMVPEDLDVISYKNEINII
ncbi:glycosyltransferase family 2 protein [Oceanirhabdus seepicola]|uniref:Glycosyltransferase family 2 protein n=1 Tax=Oceanirhabdus seepicola TaxID=2828781 RepID=A0A9J6P9T4_9CLOT|nr:glycosyltransferase family 2 protein [Oceanirhabdus seepicola]MCM1992630.1 glycosyltransferase family 2 protein [Oceanirhabdus seepicola]